MATTHAEPDQHGPDREPQTLIRWIPVVVPLLAVLLAILVYLIGAEVL
jgi:hypothetical protein